jgi:exodeoxyribonuclease-1
MVLEIKKFLEKYKNSFFLGFNSINFDEEFFRQAFWEHFIFPYLTNTNGNYRGDLLNFVTMVHAFRNEQINVERNDYGKLTFRLESLARANNFDSNESHEAIADVESTMKLMELLTRKNGDLFNVFIENSRAQNVEKKITKQKIYTYHNYLFSSHRIYLVKNLMNHPVYKNQSIGFDLKHNSEEIINLEENELKDVYKNKSFFRKIKLNKQPTILDKSFSRNVLPYSELTDEEILLKSTQLEDKNFLLNLKNVLEKEAIDLQENQSQEEKFEEDTIYSQNLNYNDSMMMTNFHMENWDQKWFFAEKFKDPRLRFFAAKHIYRNFPEELPKKVFDYLHQKISQRLFSLKKENFLTLPAAMEEADSLSLEIEEDLCEKNIKEQLDEYNIYINFLNDYYSDRSAKPLKFNSSLSDRLFS